jgi:hypothetical protein
MIESVGLGPGTKTSVGSGGMLQSGVSHGIGGHSGWSHGGGHSGDPGSQSGLQPFGSLVSHGFGFPSGGPPRPWVCKTQLGAENNTNARKHPVPNHRRLAFRELRMNNILLIGGEPDTKLSIDMTAAAPAYYRSDCE